MERHEHFWMHGHGHLWMHGHHWGQAASGTPGTLLGTLSTLLWILFFIGLAWTLLQWLIPHLADIFDKAPTDVPAMEILRQRYAAGEINDATFERMRQRLEASYPHDGPRPPT